MHNHRAGSKQEAQNVMFSNIINDDNPNKYNVSL